MVLDVAEVQDELASREDRVFAGCFAAFHEAVEHVELSIEAADDISDLLAQFTNTRNEGLDVINARDEDLVFDGFYLVLSRFRQRLETVDNVISVYLLLAVNSTSRDSE